MATSTHKVTALRFEEAERKYRITFTFWPAEGATRLCPGAEPGVEFVSAVNTASPIPLSEEELEWCAVWLEEHYDEAVEAALYDRMADEDDHADYLRRQRRDDAMLGGR